MRIINQNLITSFLKRRIIFGTTVGIAVFFMIIGVILWGGLNAAMDATNTMKFCISCHEMEENVYEEYKGTAHDANRSGVRAGCPDCHVPRPWLHKTIRKVQASYELFHKVIGTVDTKEKFDANRLKMAKRVWAAMKKTDSRECRNCHELSTMDPKSQKPRARKQHLNAMQKGNTCIDCHKGVAHKKVHDQLSDEELEEMEKPNPDFIRPIPEIYKVTLSTEDETDSEIDTEKLVQQAEKETTQAKSEIAEIITEKTSEGKKTDDATLFSLDWSKVPERTIIIFYPGQSSMEWVLYGSDHSGNRAFLSGDRCFDCHDEEAAEIGEKIVTGEILEPEETIIPGKRGSIPVKIRATHDSEHLYLQFKWPGTEHKPVPFAEGGKMDPDNQIKLAFMLATDDVQYADGAGCWGTCHHDARDMPHTPAADALSGSGLDLDFSKGVTKYLAESRTGIEIKGRRDKKRGGWDKLKDKDELQAELDAGHVMDLVRFQAGTGKVEDGYIMAQRIMEGGQGAEFKVDQSNGEWTVEMKRKLKSDKPGDISLAIDQMYNLGFAIHDDYTLGRFHHVSLGYKLGFDNDEAEINAVKQ